MATYCNEFMNNAKLLLTLWENSATNAKRSNILYCIENGADVNVRFANNANNTPLHIAVIRGDREAASILLRYGAKSNVINDEGKTALELAKELCENTDMVALLESYVEPSEETTVASIADGALVTVSEHGYKKRPGTANVRGQLYETKLLTLVYLRASRRRHITQFYLATNVDQIGDMDDVCLRFKTDTDDCVIFLQAKHKHNVVTGKIGMADLMQPSGDFSLLKYFSSYRKTECTLNNNSDNELFGGCSQDTKRYYVMYTTVKDEIDRSRKKPVARDHVMDLVLTGEHHNTFQLKYDDEYINLLTKAMITERIVDMGKTFFKLIKENKHETMLSDENIRSFHVILAQKVINVTDINEKRLRTGTFRKEFFSSNDELLILLRETMYREAAKHNNLSEREKKVSVRGIAYDPTAETIAEVIGDILTYNTSTNTLKLQDVEDEEFSTLQEMLDRFQIPQLVINEAFEISGLKKLCSLTFNLPAAFGNLDVTVNKNKSKRRLKHLANKVSDVIKESADVEGNVVLREGVYAKDKVLTAGELAIAGGVAGAVGNLLISDDNNQLKFNLDTDTLPENAKILCMKLKETVIDLHKYRFITESETFPRLSLHATEYEKKQVIDFLDNLYFYTCQTTEDQLEHIVTKEIHAHEYSDCINQSESLIKSNALFLKVHNEIQIWWMTEPTAHLVTRNTFGKIFGHFVNNGLLTYLNFIYINEINRDHLEFESDAVEVFSVCRRDARDNKMIVIHSDVHILTCHKLVQYFRGAQDYIFLDANYLYKMPPNCFQIVIDELTRTPINNVVVICEDVSTCSEVFRACDTKKLILVTNSSTVRTDACISVTDDRINLTDLTEDSQRKVLQTEFTFQGNEVTFADVYNEDMKHLINSKILGKLINKEHMSLGQTLASLTYEEIKHYYVPRTLRRNKITPDYTNDDTDANYVNLSSSSASEDEHSWSYDERKVGHKKFSPSTLIDHRNIIKRRRKSKIYDIILIIDAPGMGKSTLLTHLSLETKRRFPKIWIQRINLIDHTKQFYEWHEKKVKVDSIEALKFVCKVVMSKELYKGNVRVTDSNDDIDLEIINGETIVVNRERMDAVRSFELDTFLYCFNEGQIVFLFDGFDEICPHYKKQVTELLKYFARRTPVRDEETCSERKRSEQCVWITSRPYNDLRLTLENAFGESYTLQPFCYKSIGVFFDKYMRRNLNLSTLTTHQFMNINGFFEYMKRFHVYYDTFIKDVALVNIPLHIVYVAALDYFKSEIKRSHVTDEILKYVREWDVEVLEGFAWLKHLNNYERLMDVLTLSGVPLHVYIVINYFESQIYDTTLTDTEALVNQWDLDTNVFAFYERFIEVKLKSIRFEEKNRVDLYNPDMKMAYEKEKKDILDKHKKLAFYTTGRKELFTSDELEEVKELIKRMENGEEKTGLVDRIVDGEPRFVHYTIAEYLIVEYIIDRIKSTELENQKQMMHFIMESMLYWATKGVLNLFDLKFKFEPAIVHVMSTVDMSRVVLDTLISQSNTENLYNIFDCPYDNDYNRNPDDFTDTALDIAIRKGMKHFSACLIDSVTSLVDDTSFPVFMNFVVKAPFLKRLITSRQHELVGKILDCIRKFDASKIDDVFPYYLFDERIHSRTTNEDFIKSYHEILRQQQYLDLVLSHMSS